MVRVNRAYQGFHDSSPRSRRSPVRDQRFAQYPSQAIRLVSPFPPGGSVDVVGRLLAAKLSEIIGQQMVVGQPLWGVRGHRHRGRAELAAGRLHAAHQHHPVRLQPVPDAARSYDPLRDFVSISLVASAPSFVTVHPSLPARSIQELVALAKAKPGQLFYSAAGVGTNPHIAGELFNLLAGVNIVAVQFKGGGPADTAVIAGDVGVTFGNVSQEIGHVKAGRMRALAVTSAKRISAMPELPTVAEAGVPGYEFDTWFVRRGAQGHAALDRRHAATRTSARRSPRPSR